VAIVQGATTASQFTIPPPSPVIRETDLEKIVCLGRGKVRDCYPADDGRLVFVTTDRLSAFDVVMPNGIPDKGRVLNGLTLFWFHHLHATLQNMHVGHHLVASTVESYPTCFWPYRAQLQGRSMMVRKVKILPVECIVRGYLAGSGWKSYKKDRTVCGISLPEGLRESDQLPEILFTPSTKAETGHDENISFEEMIVVLATKLGKSESDALALAEKLKYASAVIYKEASDYAREKGIIIADTKFEFGLDADDNLVLADEVLTPDSSRFWDMEKYEPGRDQESFDKQFVRNYLETLGWDKTPPGPELPMEIIEGTRQRYLEAYYRITGKNLPTLPSAA